MIKYSLTSFLLVILSISVNAQLLVDHSGNVAIAATNSSFIPRLSVGDSCYYGPSSVNCIGIAAAPVVQEGKRNIAIEGFVKNNRSFTSDKNYGVVGFTGLNPNHGRNFGLLGTIYHNQGQQNYGGAGIYATDYYYLYHAPDNVQGIYAAYIHGNTYMSGPTRAQEIYIPADESLSDNVESMNKRDGEAVLDNLLKMNVVEFSLKNAQPVREPERSEDMTEELRAAYEYMKKEEENMYSRRHFGLSAQELQRIYPNLVLKGQDGYLCINYTELVPILIRSIQELKQQLDEVKVCKNDKTAKARGFDINFENQESTNISDAISITSSTASLAQNVPNPFTERTTIRFTLPDDTKNACICIFDMSGKMLKQIPVDATMQSITIEGYELQAGMYIYSLVVNGKEMDTKRMILSK